MGFDAWLSILVVLGIFIGLIRNAAPPDMLFVTAIAVLALFGVVTPEEAFAGFANPGMLTVGVLFVVAAGLRETGVVSVLSHYVLGKAATQRQVLGRLAGVVLPFSAFLNNTPLVAMFLPMVVEWSRRHNVSPSKLLIPLSYLAILGGTCTLIGSSTNLVVQGMMIQNGVPEMSLFELAKIGIPYAIIGVVYLMTVGQRLLPERKELLEQLGESRREYLVEMLVQPECRLVGQTVESAGLRHLPGLFLIEIDRDGQIIGPVDPNERIEAQDRLIFTGIVSSIIELERIPGLVPAADESYEVSPKGQRERRLSEVVISRSSPLIGKTIREADFRAAYGAAVVAVHRGGARVEKKVGDIRLRSGDTLLLQTEPDFMRMHKNDPTFYLVSDVQEWQPLRRDRMWVALSLFVALIALTTFGWISILVAGTLAAVLMVLTGCLAASEARRSIEWQVLITIAAAFGVGLALEKSGAAATVANLLVEVTQPWGPLAALAAMYMIVALFTEMITNNAAAALLFPFCLKTAELYEVSPRPFLIVLVLAASASFSTPIGYQTNMMVYGPGGYRFTDFFRIGAPLHVVLWVVAIVLVPYFWPL